MFVREVCIEVESAAPSADVAAQLARVIEPGPFVVEEVVPSGRHGDRHRCRFGLTHPDLAVGYRSVIELQHRIDRAFEITSVEHRASDRDVRDLVPA